MVDKKDLQHKIAELLGLKACIMREAGGNAEVTFYECNFCHAKTEIPNEDTFKPENCNYCGAEKVPKWPSSHDAARELLVEDGDRFVECLTWVVVGDWPQEPNTWRLLKATAEQWCETWVLYKGYRWVDCGDCPGDKTIHYSDSDEHCYACNGDGGEWVKDSP